jgi:hypothetical protein
MEHADCNVIVVRFPAFTGHATGPGAVEQKPLLQSPATNGKSSNGSTSAWKEAQMESERATQYVGPVPRDNSPVDPTKEQEEEERQRRIQEEKELMKKEEEDRKAAHIGAVVDEENERKRRIREDGIRVDRTFHVQIYDIDN